ncbi:MAG: hypothetical protein ACK5LX_01195 [Oscillospiraceae bacterium]
MKKGSGSKYNPLFVFREELFPKPPHQLTLEEVIREQQEKLREWEQRHRLIKCSYQTTSIEAGDMLEVSIFPSFSGRDDYRRAIREQRTGKAQQRQNLKNAQRKLVRLVHSNFKDGDIFFTGGYSPEREPASLGECEAHVTRWIKTLRYNAIQAGARSKDLKYIYVIEFTGTGRYHVHVLLSRELTAHRALRCSKCGKAKTPRRGHENRPCKCGGHMERIDSRDWVEMKWDGGDYSNTKSLQKKRVGGFTGISKYFTKQFEDMSGTELPGRRHWGQSLGLVDRTAREKKSLSKFGKRKVVDMVKATATMKEAFEKQFPGYQYPEEYPCEIRYSEVVGGFYLFCRLYRRE